MKTYCVVSLSNNESLVRLSIAAVTVLVLRILLNLNPVKDAASSIEHCFTSKNPDHVARFRQHEPFDY